MKNLNKTLLILLCAGSIGLAGCGNSAGVSKDSTTAIETVDEEKTGTAAPETAGTDEAGNNESAIADTPDSGESSILIADASVSYLGPAGTYTEEAAMFFFPEAKNMMPKGTVDEAIADVMNGTADYAVIPQENTLGGAVTNYVDALIKQNNAFVIGEVILPISQTLMGVPGAAIEDIKTVCSHAQGIKQSETWRKEHLPDAVTEEKASTAAAAEYVAEQQDKSIAGFTGSMFWQRTCRSQMPTRPGSMFFRQKSPKAKSSRGQSLWRPARPAESMTSSLRSMIPASSS